MVQGSNSTSKVAIIGAGPAGCMCAYFLQDRFDVTVFDVSKPLHTLLPTGGGRCNLAHAEYDFKELAKNYPRGEKFLYSVFSKFATAETVEFFENIGIKTYIQEDGRIFPVSNSAKDVRDKFLAALKKVRFLQQKINKLDFESFDKIVVAVGGHSSYEIINNHTIIPPKPALVGLKTSEKFPQGVSVKKVSSCGFCEDLIFTHEGISGPLIYKISSVNARCNLPYEIKLNFTGDFDFQKALNENPHKSLKNLLSEYIPKSLAEFLLQDIQDVKAHLIDGKTRDRVYELLTNYPVKIVGISNGGEVVTSGGVSLDEVDSRTMMSKIVPNLYFCGEVLDIDGFCGGFNLQNCWSTAYVAAQSILSC